MASPNGLIDSLVGQLVLLKSEQLVQDFDLLTGDALSKVESRVEALGGALTVPCRTISFASIFLPYRSLFASLSGRRVDPSRETPANAPLAREYDKISAFMAASVSAEALRPTGPAAAEASPPSFTLLERMLEADLEVISSRTKSVASPPNCKPKLAPSKAIIVGAPHFPFKSLPPRQVITPRP